MKSLSKVAWKSQNNTTILKSDLPARQCMRNVKRLSVKFGWKIWMSLIFLLVVSLFLLVFSWPCLFVQRHFALLYPFLMSPWHHARLLSYSTMAAYKILMLGIRIGFWRVTAHCSSFPWRIDKQVPIIESTPEHFVKLYMQCTVISLKVCEELLIYRCFVNRYYIFITLLDNWIVCLVDEIWKVPIWWTSKLEKFKVFCPGFVALVKPLEKFRQPFAIKYSGLEKYSSPQMWSKLKMKLQNVPFIHRDIRQKLFLARLTQLEINCSRALLIIL